MYNTTLTDEEAESAKISIKENIDSAGNAWFLMPKYPVRVSADIKAASELADGAVSIGDVTFASIRNQIYTGSAIEPEITGTYLGYTLSEGKDYTVEYSNNTECTTDASVAAATITGTGAFTGTATLSFAIVKAKSLADAVITYDGSAVPGDLAYLGGEEVEYGTVAVTFDNGEKYLTEGTDYTVEYEKNIKVGTAKVHVVAEESNAYYTGSVTKTFKVVKADINELEEAGDITVSSIAGGSYTGKAIKPNVTLKYGSYTLKKGTDYTVSYKNNKKATGTEQPATMIIKGKGGFAGTVTKTFSISTQKISGTQIEAKAKALVYTGKAQKATVTITSDTSGTLTLGRDFEITGYTFTSSESSEKDIGYTALANSKEKFATDMGTYSLLLTGIGNYGGTTTVTLKVTDKAHNLSYAKVKTEAAQFTGSKVELTEYTDAGTPCGLTITPYGATEPLTSSSGSYELEYEDNINVGSRAKLIITGDGDYAGEKIVYFKITKADIENCGLSASTVYLAKTNNEETVLYYTGYALKPDFTVNATVAAKNNGVQADASNLISLVSGKDYTVSFKDNVKGKQSSDGTWLATAVIKGKGNYTGKYETTFEIHPTSLSDFAVKVENAAYTGSNLKPTVTFTLKATGKELTLKQGTAYKVKYTNAKNVANENSAAVPTAEITATGLGYADGTSKAMVTKTFCITQAKLDASCVADIKVQTYKGKALTPKLTVKVNGRSLKLNKDYTVVYTNNDLRGTATAVITGIGSYSGTVTKTFVIK